MSKTSCEIYFDNPSRVYYTGQLLSGRVVVKLFKEASGIYMEIFGQSACYFETHETYFCEKTFFVDNNYGDIVGSPGEYNQKFSFILPEAVPTSLEEAFGHVRYGIIITVEHRLRANENFNYGFTVIRPLNLNDDKFLKSPLEKEVQKTSFICCLLCCFKTDPVFINARIPFSGYTPGQTVELSLEINNKSKRTFINFKIQIIQRRYSRQPQNNSRLILYYRSKQHVYAERLRLLVVNETFCDGCQGKQTQTHTVKIVVPSVPPTDESSDSIIKVKYHLRVQGTAGCCRMDPYLDIPIIIGTHPIRNTTTPQQLTPTYEAGFPDAGGLRFRPLYPVFR